MFTFAFLTVAPFLLTIAKSKLDILQSTPISKIDREYLLQANMRLEAIFEEPRQKMLKPNLEDI